MTKEEVQELIKKYTEGKCSPEERELLEDWADQRGAQKSWGWIDASQKAETRDRIWKKINLNPPVYSNHKLWLSGIAAAIVLICSIAFYANQQSKRIPLNRALVKKVKAVPTGAKTVTLTLADGTVHQLNNAAQGILAVENDIEIKKGNQGQLIYSQNESSATSGTALNTLNIPRGNLYQLQLADGTKVWLNSASSITYPSSFNKHDRTVSLKGEAYFEVAKDTKKPFIVNSRGVSIKVTGTHFNVSAYDDDEDLKATLLEGGVEVEKGGKKIALLPGEQAISKNFSTELTQVIIDPTNVIAWRTGDFVFEGQDLRAVMRNLSRWYDVEVSFEGDLPYEKKVGGTFSKAKGMASLLNNLEKLMGIKFKVEGRRVTVSS
jgi:transmembrane sensor